MRKRIYRADPDGRVHFDRGDVEGMTSPVQCAYCNRVYDLGTVTVTARYLDCSMWKSPCCGRTVDDRGETGWKSIKDYYPIGRSYP
jgi:hypothetical protein